MRFWTNPTRRNLLLQGVLLLVLLAWGPANRILAQEPGSAASSETLGGESAGQIGSRSVLQIIEHGGIMMAPLFVCSFLTLVFLFERAISLRRGRVIPRPFVKRFLHQVSEGKLDREGSLALCEESGSPIAEVFASVAKKWGRPAVELEQSIIDAGDRSAASLRRYLRLFNLVSTISPLLGLIGTVFGMIRLFNGISMSEAMGKAEMLAAGISEALFTTAAGLLLAVPALCIYVYFLGRVDRLSIDIDNLA